MYIMYDNIIQMNPWSCLLSDDWLSSGPIIPTILLYFTHRSPRGGQRAGSGSSRVPDVSVDDILSVSQQQQPPHTPSTYQYRGDKLESSVISASPVSVFFFYYFIVIMIHFLSV